MIANAAWLCEGIIAYVGCLFFFERRIRVLWAWLGFRTLADVICFEASRVGPRSYLWADYINRNAQYILTALVCVYAAAVILREHRRTLKTYLWLLGTLALCSVAIFHANWPPSAEAVLKFEIWAEITLSGFVALAMGTANGKAPRPWGTIAIGLVVLGTNDLAITILRTLGIHAEPFYPPGEIAALAILLFAGYKDFKLEEFRVKLPPRIQPTSVKFYHQQRWIM